MAAVLAAPCAGSNSLNAVNHGSPVRAYPQAADESLLPGAVRALGAAALKGARVAEARTAARAPRPLRLTIARLDLDLRVSRSSQDRAPMLWYEDAETSAIAGHRITHTHPFRHLERLRRGDKIVFAGRAYHVRRIFVVTPKEVWVLRYRGLVLSACTPPGSARYRLVVFAS